MRKTLFLLFTITSLRATSQDISKGVDSMRRQLNKDVASYDSVTKTSDSLLQVYIKRQDSAELARHMTQNTNNLVSFMQERERKQTKAMWTRLGFGIAMLGVLIFGLIRRRKKRSIQ